MPARGSARRPWSRLRASAFAITRSRDSPMTVGRSADTLNQPSRWFGPPEFDKKPCPRSQINRRRRQNLGGGCRRKRCIFSDPDSRGSCTKIVTLIANAERSIRLAAARDIDLDQDRGVASCRGVVLPAARRPRCSRPTLPITRQMRQTSCAGAGRFTRKLEHLPITPSHSYRAPIVVRLALCVAGANIGRAAQMFDCR